MRDNPRWYDREIDGLPDVQILHDVRRTARKEHRLGCGHIVKPGESYQDTAMIVDGDFVAITGECDICWLELGGM